MYNEQVLIDRLLSQTSYTNISVSEGMDIDMESTNGVLPKVRVGHIGIKLKYPNFLWTDGYMEIDNPQILLTNILVLCPRVNFVSVRTAIANAYKNWSPIDNADYSALNFIENNVVSTSGNNIWFVEQVGLVFPQIT